MQKYTEIPASETIRNSRQKLLDNDKTAISCNAGTAFPTANLQVGMLCFRTDLKKLYQLNTDGKTWVEIMNISGGDSYVSRASKLQNVGHATAVSSGHLPNGMRVASVYNNGYPVPYGNVIDIKGDGDSQLLLGWSDTNKGIANLYYRSARDVSGLWSEWRKIAFTTDKVDNATKADKADTLTGLNRSTGQGWGVQTGTYVTGMDVDGCSVAFRKNCPFSGKLSMMIDGKVYQNEGANACLDESQRKNATSVTHTNYPNDNNKFSDMSFLSFWNGAYNANNLSNLKYCAQGEIIGSKNIGNYSGNSTHGEKLFTANGTFTVPAGVHTVAVTCIGGGGGGGGGGSNLTTGRGGNGGRGAVVSSVPFFVTPSQSISVVVGNGGGGGATHGGAGGSGGAGNPSGANGVADSSNGGNGGTGGNYNGLAGNGGGGGSTNGLTLNVGGCGGGGGGASSFAGYIFACGGGGGGGGSSYMASNKLQAINGNSGGNAKTILYDFHLSTSYGAGGSGGAQGASGSAGHVGCVYIKW